MKKVFLIFFALPLLTFAQEGSEIVIGDRVVSYDQMERSDRTVYYFMDNEIVASTHGISAFVYENDQAVLEVHDTDGDGVFDAFLTLDTEGVVTERSGVGAATFERVESTEFEGVGGSFAATQDSDVEDLVGSLEQIDVPKHRSWGLYIVIFLLISGGVWWYTKKK